MKKRIVIKAILIFILLTFLFSLSACKEKVKTTYTAEVVFNEENYSIDCELDIILHNEYDFAIDTLSFNLYGNAYRKDAKYSPISPEKTYEAYQGKIDHGYIDIKECSINEEKADFNISGDDLNILTIPLEKPLEANDVINVKIVFTEKLAKVKHDMGYNDKTVNFGNFLPILCVYENGKPIECNYYSKGDPTYIEASTYKVSIKVPSEYSVASSGECVNAVIGGKYSTFLYEQENTRRFAFALSKNYNVISSKIDDVVLTYYYIDDEDPSRTFEIISDALHTFNEMFCRYQYKTLVIAETFILNESSTYSAICFLKSDSLKDNKEETVINAIAKCWWGDIVGSNGLENGFSPDGISSFITGVFFEENDKYQLSQKEYIDNLNEKVKGYKKIYKLTNKIADLTIKRNLANFSNTYEYYIVNHCYAATVFDYVSTLCGKEDLMKTLKFITEKYKFKNITYPEFISAFKENCVIDVSEILDNLLTGNIA